MRKRFAFTLFACWLCGSAVLAGDLQPADRPVEEVVDHYIHARLQGENLTPAPRADDAVLLRRTMLDLVGRVPTVVEAREYLQDQDSDKHEKLVDRLMRSPGYLRHQVNEFDAFLMEGSGGDLRKYLEKAFEEKKSWDLVFRELILPEPPDDPKKSSGAEEFLKRRVGDLDKLTNDVSVTFFGINVSCAKCHDHPLVSDWTQGHFYGMKSFFNRTFENGGFLAERDYGIVKYKTTKGEEHVAQLMFLSGTNVEEPQLEEPSKDEKKKESELLKKLAKEKKPPPEPEFSRRRQLVELALQPGENEFLARAIVNRLFYRFYGSGLVMPLDQMHSANPSAHPELLAWLARDLIKHDFNLDHTIRGLVLSETYARSSRWEGDDRPFWDLFAVAAVRPLTPRQFAASLRLGTTDPQQFSREMKPEERSKRIEDTARGGEGAHSLFEMPYEGFQVSVSEALLMSNNERIMRDYLNAGGGRLVSRLKEIEDPLELAETAVWNVYTRPPHDEEIRLITEYLAARKDRKEQACQQIVWSLICSSEFRFNY